MVTAVINNIETNPYLIWQKLGKPFYPTTEEFSFMKNNEVNNLIYMAFAIISSIYNTLTATSPVFW